MYLKLLPLLVLLPILIDQAKSQHPYQTLGLNLHNNYRAKHKSPAMVLDNNLSDLAILCANYYANKKVIDHTCPHKAKGTGENLVGGTWKLNQNDFTERGVKMWYDEVALYDYNKPGFSMGTGHFTQLVWKTSTKLGIGVSTVQNGYTALVALYSPQGNMMGSFPQNVQRA